MLDKVNRISRQELFDIAYFNSDNIYSFAFSIIGNVHDALDVKQEVLLRVWSRSETYDHSKSPAAWINTITRNCAFDFLRKKKREHDAFRFSELPVEDTSLVDIVEDERTAHPWYATSLKEDSRLMREAIKRLPAGERDVIELRYFSNLSYDVLAQFLSIPTGTLKSRLHIAKKRLRN